MPVTPTAGKFGGKDIWFLVDGFNVISAKLQALRAMIESDQEKTSGLGDLWDEFSPSGRVRAEVAQEGAFFFTDAGNIHDAFGGAPPSEPQATPRIGCLGFAKNAIGQIFWGFEALFTQRYEVLGTDGKLQRANVMHTVSGRIERGVILHALTAETGDATTEPASSVDNSTLPQTVTGIVSSNASDQIVVQGSHGLLVGDKVLISGHSGSTPDINGEQTVATIVDASTFTISVDITVGGTGGSYVRTETNNGGVGFLQITALTLGTWTGVRVTHRHSVDNTTFVDLLIMTDVTVAARTAERKTVAGEVRRYLAQSIDFLGAGSGGSCTYLAGFARL